MAKLLQPDLWGWCAMADAPEGKHIIVQMADGTTQVAHFARDESGEYQPAFAGVYDDAGTVLYFTGIRTPVAWRPIADTSTLRLPPMDKSHCTGCRDDHYNRRDNTCWLLNSGTLILRRRVAMAERPPWTREPEQLPSCYRQTSFVFVLPHQTK